LGGWSSREKIMTSEFEKEYSPIWCENCNQQGFIFVDNLEGSHFVTCKSCDWETSDVWCSKCGMGGEFVRKIGKRPTSWSCPNCKTKYMLPNEFYNEPITLFIEETLPKTVLERIQKDLETSQSISGQNPWLNLIKIIFITLGAFAGVIALLAIGLIPLVLVYTPLPWTIPGFIATLLIFVAWWWLMGKGIKIMRERSVKSSS
jgi:hypothetical protein